MATISIKLNESHLELISLYMANFDFANLMLFSSWAWEYKVTYYVNEINYSVTEWLLGRKWKLITPRERLILQDWVVNMQKVKELSTGPTLIKYNKIQNKIRMRLETSQPIFFVCWFSHNKKKKWVKMLKYVIQQSVTIF